MNHLMQLGAALAVFAVACKPVGNGQSSANESPVPDGNIVLVMRGKEVGAFIPNNQKASPEVTDYTWYYRADGKGTFSTNDPGVTAGTVSNATSIAFSTFAVDWSINANGRGWVYFSRGPTELGKTPDFVMCVTGETNIAAVNAKDRKWKYRGRPRVDVKALIDEQLK